jgi:CO/xanthine dehydrogenase Mo-binding subunit
MSADGAAPVGAGVPRLEIAGKVTGRAMFTDDLSLPHMLYGAILASPHAHARIRSCDTSAARNLPGVEAVITGADLPHNLFGTFIKDETLLATDRVRYVGEAVAAVAAVDRATAMAALQLIAVEYEELPTVLDPDQALAPGAPLIHEDFARYARLYDARSNGNVVCEQEIAEGDVDAAWAQCDVVVEGTYTTQAQAHVYLEPCAALAAVDDTGKVTVWSSHQSINRVQATLAESLGLPMARIRVLTPRVGGGFGGKMEYTVQPIAAALALKTGRPVKLVLSREDDFVMMRSRHPSRIRIRTGARSDGTLIAREADILCDGGAFADESPAVLGFALLMARGPYRIPNLRAHGRAVYTNKLRASGFRGFGNPQITFAAESQLDELAERLGIDPIELRLKNALRKGDRAVGGEVVQSCGLEACLDWVRSSADWARRRRSAPQGGKRRGIGIASFGHVCGLMGSSAVIRLIDDGSVTLSTGAVDIGQGSDTALAQMCAATLGIEIDKVNLVAPDTDASPYNWGTAGSRVTYMAGRAVVGAAQDVVTKILDHAAQMFECAPADLELRAGGRVGLRGIAGKELGFREIALHSLYRVGGPIIGSHSVVFDGASFDPKRTAMKGFPYRTLGIYYFGAQAVEVEVDEATGQVRVVGAWLAHDVGRAINPVAVEGQIQGGFVQGLGYALFEEMVWDGGRLANPNLMDYKIPGSADLACDVAVRIIEDPEPTGPFGAKGVGEGGIVGIAAAVANAVANATGARIRDLPVTPERVLRALMSAFTTATETGRRPE